MKWLSVHVGGQKWRVDLVKSNSAHFEGDNCYGISYPDRCRIYLAKEQDEQALEDTLLHELLHAALHVSGGSQKLFEATRPGAEPADPEKLEEDIVRGLVLVLHPLLKDTLGCRFPKRPPDV